MRLDHLLSREKRQAKSKPNPRSSFWGNRDVETEVKKSGSEPQQNRRKAGYDLTELLIETLYRFEGSERPSKNSASEPPLHKAEIQPRPHLENCTGKKTERRSQSKIQSKFRIDRKGETEWRRKNTAVFILLRGAIPRLRRENEGEGKIKRQRAQGGCQGTNCR